MNNNKNLKQLGAKINDICTSELMQLTRPVLITIFGEEQVGYHDMIDWPHVKLKNKADEIFGLGLSFQHDIKKENESNNPYDITPVITLNKGVEIYIPNKPFKKLTGDENIEVVEACSLDLLKLSKELNETECIADWIAYNNWEKLV